MSDHERFEELASLAAMGELSPAEHEEFSRHKRVCRVCQAIVAETGSIAISAFSARTTTSEEQSTEDAGYHRAKGAVTRHLARVPVPFPRRRQQLLAAGIAATLLFGIGLGTSLALWRIQANAPFAGTPIAATRTTNSETAGAAAPTLAPETAAHWQTVVASLQQQIDDTQEQSHALQTKLSASDRYIATLEQRIELFAQQSNAQAQKLEQVQSDLIAARADASQVRESLSARDAAIDTLRFKLNDKDARLQELSSGLDREREMLSEGREVRDIMGARDLHIVDVVDVDEKGHNRKVFGRAFYTQGKSLIFYAFDLPARNTAGGKFVYAAWGRNSAKLHGQEPQSLGIFFNDDQTQHRWAMKFEDRKVLEEIDTVFVTLEPAGHSFISPTTKPILQAYFGTPPNHP